MIKFIKEHPYLTIGYFAIASISVGIGFRDGISDGFIIFGVATALVTVYSFMVNEE